MPTVKQKMTHGKNRWVGGRLRPLRQRIRRGLDSPRDALTRLVGAELADRWCDALGRMCLGSAASPHEERSMSAKGRVKGRRFTACSRLDATQKRGDQSPELVGPVLLLLHVLDHIRPGGSRAWTKELWLGKPNCPPEKARGLAMALGVCVRELQRWLAALRTIGALTNWQPPGHNAPPGARTRKGRAYSCYAIPDYGKTWHDWQAQRVASDATEAPKPEVAPAGARPALSGRAAAFMAMIPDSLAPE